jgi:hypothetical protein
MRVFAGFYLLFLDLDLVSIRATKMHHLPANYYSTIATAATLMSTNDHDVKKFHPTTTTSPLQFASERAAAAAAAMNLAHFFPATAVSPLNSFSIENILSSKQPRKADVVNIVNISGSPVNTSPPSNIFSSIATPSDPYG